MHIFFSAKLGGIKGIDIKNGSNSESYTLGSNLEVHPFSVFNFFESFTLLMIPKIKNLKHLFDNEENTIDFLYEKSIINYMTECPELGNKLMQISSFQFNAPRKLIAKYILVKLIKN
ncbi:hypothetical protein H311_00344 [Anncaliia algerae PRA109]|nr:hypothetical protein H311_00344 [Anncaliia algerae PRA109]